MSQRSSQLPIVGRFAPSPTGVLHFGSLVAALASYLAVRSRSGQWLLRMEDLDRQRCRPQWAVNIVQDLVRLGFEWDGEVLYQSQRVALYRAALEALQAESWVFPCVCTRREMLDSALARDGSRRYNGRCRQTLPSEQATRAWRFKAPAGEQCWLDGVQGVQREDVARDVGDFVLLRADGEFAYQLAVVVDDAAQGVTEVVRGADLLDSTARQQAVQRALGLPELAYWHVPVATNAAGEKLSKQTLARGLAAWPATQVLCAAWRFLGQVEPPVGLWRAPVAEFWLWAFVHWRTAAIPAQRQLMLAPSLFDFE